MPLILLSHFPSAYVGGVKERNQEETRREKGKNYESLRFTQQLFMEVKSPRNSMPEPWNISNISSVWILSIAVSTNK